jgi:hypothetical protein
MNARSIKTVVEAVKQQMRNAVGVLQAPPPHVDPAPIPVLVEERRRR